MTVDIVELEGRANEDKNVKKDTEKGSGIVITVVVMVEGRSGERSQMVESDRYLVVPTVHCSRTRPLRSCGEARVVRRPVTKVIGKPKCVCYSTCGDDHTERTERRRD